MKIGRALQAFLACASIATPAAAQTATPTDNQSADTKAASGRFVWSTRSQGAKDAMTELQRRIESFQFQPPLGPMAEKIVELDPEWALAHYYVSATNPPPKNKGSLAKAVAIAKTGHDSERRFIEALALVRDDKAAAGLPLLESLAKDYPGERAVQVILGQVLTGLGRTADARAAYTRAIAIDASTPRAYALLANLDILAGDYAKARAAYEAALPKVPKGAAPGQIRYGVAYTHLYEGNVDEALKTLQGYVAEYRDSGAAAGLPEVFIWNSIARINLEHGRTEEAMKAYQKGHESVPGSSIDEQQKAIWKGRLHHGVARTLARMGKHADAWKEAETVRLMIEGGGSDGTPFLPAYHYLAGYVKLQAGDAKTALEHLKQADGDDEFHNLLLARAYEKLGDIPNARKAWQAVVDSSTSNLERALAYREAKEKLASVKG